MAKAYRGTLYGFKSLSALRVKDKIEDRRMKKDPKRGIKHHEKLQKKIEKSVTDIEKKFKPFFAKYSIKTLDDYPTIAAFVTFNEYADKIKVK